MCEVDEYGVRSNYGGSVPGTFPARLIFFLLSVPATDIFVPKVKITRLCGPND